MRPLSLWTIGLLAIVLTACSVSASQESEQRELTRSPDIDPVLTSTESMVVTATSTKEALPPTPSLKIEAIEQIDLPAVPRVDPSRFGVPLEEIIFDTFRPANRAVPLSEAQPALIRSLMDAIPPIYDPRFVSAAATDQWLEDSDIVLGYTGGNDAYAYPIKILNFHEMVSHRVNGRDILASYCPLCRSGIIYDRILTGAEAPLLFGNTSALYESDMVMFDHQTGSYWNQVSGEAIVGPLTGKRLEILPGQMTTWGRWKELYPNTLGLSEDTGFDRNYRNDPFSGYGESINAGGQFFFPVSDAGRDPRLDPAEIVLALEVNDSRRAYPLDVLGDAVVHDLLGETVVVVFSQEDGGGGAAFIPRVDGRELTFELKSGRIQDQETDSIWNLAGRAIDGELVGSQLEPLPARTTYWFSIVANFPDIEVYRPEN